MTKYTGTGVITDEDYKSIKWVGKTKGGNPVTVTMPQAINLGNIDLTMVEKGDTVPEITFTAVYDNTDNVSSSTQEPWSIEVDGVKSGASEILLGAGIFYVDDKEVGLTRGGGKVSIAREYRRINADSDRGPVKGRIELESSEATLTMNVLTMLTKFADLYPAIKTTTTTQAEE